MRYPSPAATAGNGACARNQLVPSRSASGWLRRGRGSVARAVALALGTVAAVLLVAGRSAGAAHKSDSFGAIELLEVMSATIWCEPAPRPIPGLLNIPPDWAAGDAVAVVVSPHSGPDRLRDRITAALLASGAAVVELDIDAARSSATDSAAAPLPPSSRDMLPDLFAVLSALRRDHAAGIVTTLGIGEAGAAALLATVEAEAAQRLGPDGPRFAAGAWILDGRVNFAAGTAPAASERWDVRAELFCALVTSAAGFDAAAGRGPSSHPAHGCLAASSGTASAVLQP
jgi:hypothetical protein